MHKKGDLTWRSSPGWTRCVNMCNPTSRRRSRSNHIHASKTSCSLFDQEANDDVYTSQTVVGTACKLAKRASGLEGSFHLAIYLLPDMQMCRLPGITRLATEVERSSGRSDPNQQNVLEPNVYRRAGYIART